MITHDRILHLDPDDADAEGRRIQRVAGRHDGPIAEALAEQGREIAAAIEKDNVSELQRAIEALGAAALLAALLALLQAGAREGLDTGRTVLGRARIGVNWRLAAVTAMQWAGNYNYELVAGINATTRRMLSDAIVRWAGTGAPLSDLVDDVAAVFGPERAARIAVTEATRAYSEGAFATYEQAGFRTRPAEEHRPPLHPNCRCWVALAEHDGRWVYLHMTASDRRVCEICGPRHLQEIGPAR